MGDELLSDRWPSVEVLKLNNRSLLQECTLVGKNVALHESLLKAYQEQVSASIKEKTMTVTRPARKKRSDDLKTISSNMPEFRKHQEEPMRSLESPQSVVQPLACSKTSPIVKPPRKKSKASNLFLTSTPISKETNPMKAVISHPENICYNHKCVENDIRQNQISSINNEVAVNISSEYLEHLEKEKIYFVENIHDAAATTNDTDANEQLDKSKDTSENFYFIVTAPEGSTSSEFGGCPQKPTRKKRNIIHPSNADRKQVLGATISLPALSGINYNNGIWTPSSEYRSSISILDFIKPSSRKSSHAIKKAHSVAALTDRERARPLYMHIQPEPSKNPMLLNIRKRIDSLFSANRSKATCWPKVFKRKKLKRLNTHHSLKLSNVESTRSAETFSSIFINEKKLSQSVPYNSKQELTGSELFTTDIKDNIVFPSYVLVSDSRHKYKKTIPLRERLLHQKKNLNKGSTASLDPAALKKAFSFLENKINRTASSDGSRCTKEKSKKNIHRSRHNTDSVGGSCDTLDSDTTFGGLTIDGGKNSSDPISDHPITNKKISLKTTFLLRATSVPDMAPRILKAFSKHSSEKPVCKMFNELPENSSYTKKHFGGRSERACGVHISVAPTSEPIKENEEEESDTEDPHENERENVEKNTTVTNACASHVEVTAISQTENCLKEQKLSTTKHPLHDHVPLEMHNHNTDSMGGSCDTLDIDTTFGGLSIDGGNLKNCFDSVSGHSITNKKISLKAKFFLRATSVPDMAPRILKAFSKHSSEKPVCKTFNELPERSSFTKKHSVDRSERACGVHVSVAPTSEPIKENEEEESDTGDPHSINENERENVEKNTTVTNACASHVEVTAISQTENYLKEQKLSTTKHPLQDHVSLEMHNHNTDSMGGSCDTLDIDTTFGGLSINGGNLKNCFDSVSGDPITNKKISLKAKFFLRATSVPDMAPRILKVFPKHSSEKPVCKTFNKLPERSSITKKHSVDRSERACGVHISVAPSSEPIKENEEEESDTKEIHSTNKTDIGTVEKNTAVTTTCASHVEITATSQPEKSLREQKLGTTKQSLVDHHSLKIHNVEAACKTGTEVASVTVSEIKKNIIDAIVDRQFESTNINTEENPRSFGAKHSISLKDCHFSSNFYRAQAPHLKEAATKQDAVTLHPQKYKDAKDLNDENVNKKVIKERCVDPCITVMRYNTDVDEEYTANGSEMNCIVSPTKSKCLSGNVVYQNKCETEVRKQKEQSENLSDAKTINDCVNFHSDSADHCNTLEKCCGKFDTADCDNLKKVPESDADLETITPDQFHQEIARECESHKKSSLIANQRPRSNLLQLEYTRRIRKISIPENELPEMDQIQASTIIQNSAAQDASNIVSKNNSNFLSVHDCDDFYDFFRDRAHDEHYAYVLDSDSDNEQEGAVAASEYRANARKSSIGEPSHQLPQKMYVETGSLSQSDVSSRRSSDVPEQVEKVENNICDYFIEPAAETSDEKLDISIEKDEFVVKDAVKPTIDQYYEVHEGNIPKIKITRVKSSEITRPASVPVTTTLKPKPKFKISDKENIIKPTNPGHLVFDNGHHSENLGNSAETNSARPRGPVNESRNEESSPKKKDTLDHYNLNLLKTRNSELYPNPGLIDAVTLEETDDFFNYFVDAPNDRSTFSVSQRCDAKLENLPPEATSFLRSNTLDCSGQLDCNNFGSAISSDTTSHSYTPPPALASVLTDDSQTHLNSYSAANAQNKAEVISALIHTQSIDLEMCEDTICKNIERKVNEELNLLNNTQYQCAALCKESGSQHLNLLSPVVTKDMQITELLEVKGDHDFESVNFTANDMINSKPVINDSKPAYPDTQSVVLKKDQIFTKPDEITSGFNLLVHACSEIAKDAPSTTAVLEPVANENNLNLKFPFKRGSVESHIECSRDISVENFSSDTSGMKTEPSDGFKSVFSNPWNRCDSKETTLSCDVVSPQLNGSFSLCEGVNSIGMNVKSEKSEKQITYSQTSRTNPESNVTERKIQKESDSLKNMDDAGTLAGNIYIEKMFFPHIPKASALAGRDLHFESVNFAANVMVNSKPVINDRKPASSDTQSVVLKEDQISTKSGEITSGFNLLVHDCSEIAKDAPSTTAVLEPVANENNFKLKFPLKRDSVESHIECSRDISVENFSSDTSGLKTELPSDGFKSVLSNPWNRRCDSKETTLSCDVVSPQLNGSFSLCEGVTSRGMNVKSEKSEKQITYSQTSRTNPESNVTERKIQKENDSLKNMDDAGTLAGNIYIEEMFFPHIPKASALAGRDLHFESVNFAANDMVNSKPVINDRKPASSDTQSVVLKKDQISTKSGEITSGFNLLVHDCSEIAKDAPSTTAVLEPFANENNLNLKFPLKRDSVESHIECSRDISVENFSSDTSGLKTELPSDGFKSVLSNPWNRSCDSKGTTLSCDVVSPQLNGSFSLCEGVNSRGMNVKSEKSEKQITYSQSSRTNPESNVTERKIQKENDSLKNMDDAGTLAGNIYIEEMFFPHIPKSSALAIKTSQILKLDHELNNSATKPVILKMIEKISDVVCGKENNEFPLTGNKTGNYFYRRNEQEHTREMDLHMFSQKEIFLLNENNGSAQSQYGDLQNIAVLGNVSSLASGTPKMISTSHETLLYPDNSHLKSITPGLPSYCHVRKSLFPSVSTSDLDLLERSDDNFSPRSLAMGKPTIILQTWLERQNTDCSHRRSTKSTSDIMEIFISKLQDTTKTSVHRSESVLPRRLYDTPSPGTPIDQYKDEATDDNHHSHHHLQQQLQKQRQEERVQKDRSIDVYPETLRQRQKAMAPSPNKVDIKNWNENSSHIRESSSPTEGKKFLPSVRALRNQFESGKNLNGLPANNGSTSPTSTVSMSSNNSASSVSNHNNGSNKSYEPASNHANLSRWSGSSLAGSFQEISSSVTSLNSALSTENLLDGEAHDPNEPVEPIFCQFQKVDEQLRDLMSRPTSTTGWNPLPLLKRLYDVPEIPRVHTKGHSFINIEGYLEKLPSGRKKATFWNAWKRRYFVAKDGVLHCYQNSQCDKPSMRLTLMGGKVETMDGNMVGFDDGIGDPDPSSLFICIDDGKGHYVAVRCSSHSEAERWRRALDSHLVEDFASQYVQPHPLTTNPSLLRDTLIIDIGSCSMRAGVLSSQATLPQVFFPTVLATDRESLRQVWGAEALSAEVRSTASLTFPIRPSHRISKYSVDLNAVAGVLTKTFNDLKVDPKNYNLQISVPRVLNQHTQSEFLRILFEKFGVKGVNITHQSILALYAYNATSGIVVDIGERMDIVPVIDGYMVDGGVSRVPYGGCRMMDHLRQFLYLRNVSLVNDVESFIIRHVLESVCYCAQHYNTEKARCTNHPDNFEKSVPLSEFFPSPEQCPYDSVELDFGRFQATEGLFNPDAWGLDHPGLHKLVHKAIQECSMDIRKEMSRSIFLAGGVTQLPGLADRLTTELDNLTPPAIRPKVHVSPYRYHAAYIGACTLAESPAFPQTIISRDNWAKNGNAALRKWAY